VRQLAEGILLPPPDEAALAGMLSCARGDKAAGGRGGLCWRCVGELLLPWQWGSSASLQAADGAGSLSAIL